MRQRKSGSGGKRRQKKNGCVYLLRKPKANAKLSERLRKNANALKRSGDGKREPASYGRRNSVGSSSKSVNGRSRSDNGSSKKSGG
jgi:hypothetical protein